MRTTALICAIVAGAIAGTPIAPATAQAGPIDMTGEDFRYLHAQAVADAKKRLAVTDLRKAVAQQRSRPPRMYDSRIVPGVVTPGDGGEAITSRRARVVGASPPTWELALPAR